MLLRVFESLSSSSSMHSTDGRGASTFAATYRRRTRVLEAPEDSAYFRFRVMVAGKFPAGCH